MQIPVALADRVIVCEVARTARDQARGLQGHPGLADGEGMLFPFHPPRATTFHMGAVAFPIDLIFADAGGRIARIVHAATPGVQTRWSHPVTSAVIEVPGGFCARHNVAVGAQVAVAGQRLGAQTTYNLLRTLVEADAPLGPGYYGAEPLSDRPQIEMSDVPPDERFQHSVLPDEGPFSNDQPDPHFEETFGYQPEENFEEGEIGPVRRGYVLSAHGWRRWAQRLVDESEINVLTDPWRRSQILNANPQIAVVEKEVAELEAATMAAYEAGDLARAEDLDAQLEARHMDLEAMVDALVSEGAGADWEMRDQDEGELMRELAERYQAYLSKSLPAQYGESNDLEGLAVVLRSLLSVVGGDPNVTDQQVVEAAQDAYERVQHLRAPKVKPSKVARRQAAPDASGVPPVMQVDDPTTFAGTVVQALEQTGGFRWQPDANGGVTESCALTGQEIAAALLSVGADYGTQEATRGVLETPQGLEMLADAFVRAGVCDQGKVKGRAIALYRGRR